MSKNGYSDEQAEDIEKRWFIATGCTFGDDEAGEYLAAILRLAYLAQGVGDTSREEILMEWAWDDLLAVEKEAERGRG